MPFVVKATGTTGTICWLSPAGEAGLRALATREWADVFPTVADARVAIAKLPGAFVDTGLAFTVEERTDRHGSS
jgi:hypothetical protein